MALGRDIAVDLGTSAVRIYARGKGLRVDEPSVAAIDKVTGKMLGAGLAAQRMLGRTPGNIAAIRPLIGGAISDYEMTERMLRELIRKVDSVALFKPRILITVPSGITEVEERAVIDAGIAAGARKIFLIEAPIASALGAGVDIAEPDGHMVVDIGGGTTDIAVLSLSGVVRSGSLKIAGDAFSDAIVRYVKRKHNILIGERTAENLKLELGSVYPSPDVNTMEVKGRCLLTGLPRVFTINSDELRDAFEEPVEHILEELRSVLENTPPELVADVSSNGIVLTGGGALLRGLDTLVTARTNIRCNIANNTALCGVHGAGKALNWLNEMQEGAINLARQRQLDR
ncbi:MAG: rod shape-determining protein [Oscillospiraceae bacterium]|jgi:rod shape-determining protein MreB|nr:rod shape-determining protein [Oscillospiraceae bacterium]